MQCKILTKPCDEFAICRDIRRIVFTEEQGVPESREQDDLDYYSVHYLFSTVEGQPFGTARSRIENTYSKIERFAFLPEFRGKGLAAKAFMYVVTDCFQRYPSTPIIINSQSYLEDFYLSLGFVPEGDLFIDAGIWHRRMRMEAPEMRIKARG